MREHYRFGLVFNLIVVSLSVLIGCFNFFFWPETSIYYYLTNQIVSEYSSYINNCMDREKNELRLKFEASYNCMIQTNENENN